MRTLELKDIVEREPFRPFALRLNNGAHYDFSSRRELGATQNYKMIFFFGKSGNAVRIDSDSIVEIIEND